jgi:hypothetical protein
MKAFKVMSDVYNWNGVGTTGTGIYDFYKIFQRLWVRHLAGRAVDELVESGNTQAHWRQ